MNEEVYFHYKETQEYARLFLWYQGSQFSSFKGKASKTEAERCKYLSNYHLSELGKLVRGMMSVKQ